MVNADPPGRAVPRPAAAARRCRPETTEGREGFLHPYRIEGGVAETTIRILLRDFDTPKLAEQAELLRAVAPDDRGGVSRARRSR